MPKLITKELMAKETPKWPFKEGFRLSDVTQKPSDNNPNHIAEFTGTGDFNAQWVERQRYEVEAGREMEPLLYQSFYDITQDASLPRNISIYEIGPGAVIFEEVKEGGEVKFVTIDETTRSVTVKHYGAGLEYSKDLRIYNELWNVALVERQAGVAFNALLNHIHINPIIAYSYAAANQTPASSVGTHLVEKYLRTLEDAIVNSKTDTTNPRYGPYDLLVAAGDMFMVERMLRRVPQEGVELQSSAMSMVQNVIVYDGWTGTRGKESVSYAGVTAGKGYLINKRHIFKDFRSFVKQDLSMAMGNPDVSRFIEQQVIWDTYFGAYANPAAAVEEITWPTS